MLEEYKMKLEVANQSKWCLLAGKLTRRWRAAVQLKAGRAGKARDGEHVASSSFKPTLCINRTWEPPAGCQTLPAGKAVRASGIKPNLCLDRMVGWAAYVRRERDGGRGGQVLHFAAAPQGAGLWASSCKAMMCSSKTASAAARCYA